MKNDQKRERAEAKAKASAANKEADRGGRGGGGRGRGRGRGRGAAAVEADVSLCRKLFPEEAEVDEASAASAKPAPAPKKAQKPKAKAKKGAKRPSPDDGEDRIVEHELGWDYGEDGGELDAWPVKEVPDPVPGATPMVIRKGRSRCPSKLLGKLSPMAAKARKAGRSPATASKKRKSTKPVVRKMLLWQNEDGSLNDDWVDRPTKKRIMYLMTNMATATFEEVKSHLMAHRSEFKKTQLTAYWTRSAVGLKLLLDPCRPQLCTVCFKKDYPNSWNMTMVAAYGVILKLVFRLKVWKGGLHVSYTSSPNENSSLTCGWYCYNHYGAGVVCIVPLSMYILKLLYRGHYAFITMFCISSS